MTLTSKDSFHPTTTTEWWKWLEKYHARDDGVWLISFKLATGKPRVSYDAAVEIALCFGWIDSKPGTLDEARSKLWFSPRKKGSAWSQKNKVRVERLIKSNQMHASGLTKVKEAKLDGSWSKLDSVEALEIPSDLGHAFKAYPGSSLNFEAFPRSAKRAILEWIGNAKTESTRAKRIIETASLAAANIRANQWKKNEPLEAVIKTKSVGPLGPERSSYSTVD